MPASCHLVILSLSCSVTCQRLVCPKARLGHGCRSDAPIFRHCLDGTLQWYTRHMFPWYWLWREMFGAEAKASFRCCLAGKMLIGPSPIPLFTMHFGNTLERETMNVWEPRITIINYYVRCSDEYVSVFYHCKFFSSGFSYDTCIFDIYAFRFYLSLFESSFSVFDSFFSWSCINECWNRLSESIYESVIVVFHHWWTATKLCRSQKLLCCPY